jgi:acyl carrier protein
MSTSTEDRIRSFIFDELMDGQPATGDPIAEGKLDSLAMEQVIGFLEDEYQVSFGDEDLVPENFTNLAAVAALVESKRAARADS